jgi:hypothetical protein
MRLFALAKFLSSSSMTSLSLAIIFFYIRYDEDVGNNSFALSLSCWINVLYASIFANTVLFTNLVAAIVLSATLLTVRAYSSVALLGDTQ